MSEKYSAPIEQTRSDPVSPNMPMAKSVDSTSQVFRTLVPHGLYFLYFNYIVWNCIKSYISFRNANFATNIEL